MGNTRLSFAKNSAGVLDIVDKNDYYPFGMNHLDVNAGSFFGQSSYKNYKYNGKELQETGMYDYGARMYMADIGRWGVMDALSEKHRRHSPYNYAVNNPVMFIDPDGNDVASVLTGQEAINAYITLRNSMSSNTDGNENFSYMGGFSLTNNFPPHEYEVNWKTGEVKKISNLGGDEIDFYHYIGGGLDGKTRIVDRATGADQWMSSSKNIKGYTQRDNSIGWKRLYNEFLDGNGPEKSLLVGKDSKAVSEMMDTQIYQDAAERFLDSSTNEKISYAPSFGPLGAIRENINMQGQFMGKTNFSFYPIGNNVVVMAFDSKSISSYSFNPFNKGEERNIPRSQGIGTPQSTTYQTYIFWTKKTNLFK